jgi:hypothetical protein
MDKKMQNGNCAHIVVAICGWKGASADWARAAGLFLAARVGPKHLASRHAPCSSNINDRQNTMLLFLLSLLFL